MCSSFTLSTYCEDKEEHSLLKAGLYFSIQPDKTRKCEIFPIFEKIRHSFINNLKSKKTKVR